MSRSIDTGDVAPSILSDQWQAGGACANPPVLFDAESPQDEGALARAEKLGKRVSELADQAVKAQVPRQTRHVLLLYDKSVRLWAEALGPEHQEVGHARYLMWELARDTGEVHTALACMADACRIFAVAYGPEHDTTRDVQERCSLWLNALTQIPSATMRRGLEPHGPDDISRRPHRRGTRRAFDFDRLPLSGHMHDYLLQDNSAERAFTRSNIPGLCPKLDRMFTRFMVSTPRPILSEVRRL